MKCEECGEIKMKHNLKGYEIDVQGVTYRLEVSVDLYGDHKGKDLVVFYPEDKEASLELVENNLEDDKVGKFINVYDNEIAVEKVSADPEGNNLFYSLGIVVEGDFPLSEEYIEDHPKYIFNELLG